MGNIVTVTVISTGNFVIHDFAATHGACGIVVADVAGQVRSVLTDLAAGHVPHGVGVDVDGTIAFHNVLGDDTTRHIEGVNLFCIAGIGSVHSTGLTNVVVVNTATFQIDGSALTVVLDNTAIADTEVAGDSGIALDGQHSISAAHIHNSAGTVGCGVPDGCAIQSGDRACATVNNTHTVGAVAVLNGNLVCIQSAVVHNQVSGCVHAALSGGDMITHISAGAVCHVHLKRSLGVNPCIAAVDDQAVVQGQGCAGSNFEQGAGVGSVTGDLAAGDGHVAGDGQLLAQGDILQQSDSCTALDSISSCDSLSQGLVLSTVDLSNGSADNNLMSAVFANDLTIGHVGGHSQVSRCSQGCIGSSQHNLVITAYQLGSLGHSNIAGDFCISNQGDGVALGVVDILTGSCNGLFQSDIAGVLGIPVAALMLLIDIGNCIHHSPGAVAVVLGSLNGHLQQFRNLGGILHLEDVVLVEDVRIVGAAHNDDVLGVLTGCIEDPGRTIAASTNISQMEVAAGDGDDLVMLGVDQSRGNGISGVGATFDVQLTALVIADSQGVNVCIVCGHSHLAGANAVLQGQSAVGVHGKHAHQHGTLGISKLFSLGADSNGLAVQVNGNSLSSHIDQCGKTVGVGNRVTAVHLVVSDHDDGVASRLGCLNSGLDGAVLSAVDLSHGDCGQFQTAIEGCTFADGDGCGSLLGQVDVLIEGTAGDRNSGILAPCTAFASNGAVEIGGNILQRSAVNIGSSGSSDFAAGDGQRTVNGILAGVLHPDSAVALNQTTVNGNAVLIGGAVAELADCGGVVVVQMTTIDNQNSVAGGAVVIDGVLCMCAEVSNRNLAAVDSQGTTIGDGVVTLTVGGISRAGVIVVDDTGVGVTAVVDGQGALVGDHGFALSGAGIGNSLASQLQDNSTGDDQRSIQNHIAQQSDSCTALDGIGSSHSLSQSSVLGLADLSGHRKCGGQTLRGRSLQRAIRNSNLTCVFSRIIAGNGIGSFGCARNRRIIHRPLIGIGQTLQNVGNVRSQGCPLLRQYYRRSYQLVACSQDIALCSQNCAGNLGFGVFILQPVTEAIALVYKGACHLDLHIGVCVNSFGCFSIQRILQGDGDYFDCLISSQRSNIINAVAIDIKAEILSVSLNRELIPVGVVKQVGILQFLIGPTVVGINANQVRVVRCDVAEIIHQLLDSRRIHLNLGIFTQLTGDNNGMAQLKSAVLRIVQDLGIAGNEDVGISGTIFVEIALIIMDFGIHNVNRRTVNMAVDQALFRTILIEFTAGQRQFANIILIRRVLNTEQATGRCIVIIELAVGELHGGIVRTFGRYTRNATHIAMVSVELAVFCNEGCANTHRDKTTVVVAIVAEIIANRRIRNVQSRSICMDHCGTAAMILNNRILDVNHSILCINHVVCSNHAGICTATVQGLKVVASPDSAAVQGDAVDGNRLVNTIGAHCADHHASVCTVTDQSTTVSTGLEGNIVCQAGIHSNRALHGNLTIDGNSHITGDGNTINNIAIVPHHIFGDGAGNSISGQLIDNIVCQSSPVAGEFVIAGINHNQGFAQAFQRIAVLNDGKILTSNDQGLQAGAVGDGTVSHALQRVRQNQSLQRGAAIKCADVQSLDTLAQSHILQASAAVEHGLAHGFHGGGDHNALQSGTALEHIAADGAGKAFLDGKVLQAGAAVEGIGHQIGDVLGDGNRFQRSAALEGVVANLGQSLGELNDLQSGAVAECALRNHSQLGRQNDLFQAVAHLEAGRAQLGIFTQEGNLLQGVNILERVSTDGFHTCGNRQFGDSCICKSRTANGLQGARQGHICQLGTSPEGQIANHSCTLSNEHGFQLVVVDCQLGAPGGNTVTDLQGLQRIHIGKSCAAQSGHGVGNLNGDNRICIIESITGNGSNGIFRTADGDLFRDHDVAGSSLAIGNLGILGAVDDLVNNTVDGDAGNLRLVLAAFFSSGIQTIVGILRRILRGIFGRVLGRIFRGVLGRSFGGILGRSLGLVLSGLGFLTALYGADIVFSVNVLVSFLCKSNVGGHHADDHEHSQCQSQETLKSISHFLHSFLS